MGATMDRSVRIRAPVDVVWALVADPVMESTWNPKIIAVDRGREGPVVGGEQFTMMFAMGGRQQEMDVEVLSSEPGSRVEMVYTPRDGVGGPVTIWYRLRTSARVTRVRQSIDLSRSGMPGWARAAVWVISRIGRPVGTPYLQRLRSQAESASG